jgi:hypothetical protein
MENSAAEHFQKEGMTHFPRRVSIAKKTTQICDHRLVKCLTQIRQRFTAFL